MNDFQLSVQSRRRRFAIR